jgi:hypothetical protein
MRMPLSQARELVASGFAKTVNRGKSIELFALRALKLRDRSCSWSHRLMELVGEGNYAACKLLEWMGERSHMQVSEDSWARNDYETPMDAQSGEMLEELNLGVSA